MIVWVWIGQVLARMFGCMGEMGMGVEGTDRFGFF